MYYLQKEERKMRINDVKEVFRLRLFKSEEIRLWRQIKTPSDPLIKEWIEFLKRRTKS